MANSSRSDTPLHALTVHPDVSPADRLGVTFFFAVLAHLIVILGVTFVHEDRPERHATTLDVVLVPLSAAEVPDRPDYLAQANHDGGGESAEMVRPETPPPAALGPTNTGHACRGRDGGGVRHVGRRIATPSSRRRRRLPHP